MSTAVGGCGPSGCSALHRTSAPCTISYRSGAIAGSRAFAKLPLGPFVSVDNARATVSKRDRDRAPPASDGHSDEIGFADRDSRSARLERPVTAPRAPPGCDRPEDARHPEQTRARVAGAGERPEVVAAAARIASRMCDDKTYVWSNFRFFWRGELETDISSAIASKLGAPLHMTRNTHPLIQSIDGIDGKASAETHARWGTTPIAALRRCLSCEQPFRMRAREPRAR